MHSAYIQIFSKNIFQPNFSKQYIQQWELMVIHVLSMHKFDISYHNHSLP